MGYRNLADLQFRIGEIESGLDSAKKALEMAEKAKDEKLYRMFKGISWLDTLSIG